MSFKYRTLNDQMFLNHCYARYLYWAHCGRFDIAGLFHRQAINYKKEILNAI